MQISRQEFETWLDGTKLLSLDSGIATIGTPSPFLKEGLENRYMAPLRRSIEGVVGYAVQLQIVIAPKSSLSEEPHSRVAEHVPDQEQEEEQQNTYAKTYPVPEEHHAHVETHQNGTHAKKPTNQKVPTPLSTNNHHTNNHDTGNLVQLDMSSAIRSGMLNPKYTFFNFIVGSSNRMAHAACLAVADHPAQAYNPLFVYGGVGLGKTHLLHAIGNSILDRDPEITVLYVSSEKFTNDLINAIRRQQTEEFRARYRNIDVLLIDDIQFIAGKDATQEEFFHTFNTLHSAGKQIVMSSDRPPKAIITLEERLRSRFEWGLIVDIQPPDLETRTAILRTKGEQMNVTIPEEVIDFLAYKIQSNIRELEGCLNRVTAYADLNHHPITVKLATEALADILDDSRRKRITPELILKVVSEYYSIETPVIKGRGRSRNIVIPRQVAMYLLREETGSSLVEIGTLLGGRDHTTVMYGCDKISEDINTDSRLRNEVLAIREKLYQKDSQYI